MLTEAKFREIYELAGELATGGGEAAARELWLYLFDYGETVGGFGAARLTFVLRDLAGLAERGGPEGERTAAALAARRDAREALARRGEAGFAQLQELVALYRYRGELARARDLYDRLKEAGDGPPDLTEVRRTLADLLREETWTRDPELLAEEILRERLQRRLRELAAAVSDLTTLLHLGRDTAEERPLRERITWLARDLAALISRSRIDGEPARGREAAAERLRLARDVSGLLTRHRLLESGALPEGEGAAARVGHLGAELSDLLRRHDLTGETSGGEALRRQVLQLARDVAVQVSDQRVWEDFGTPAPRHGELAAEVIRRDGLLVYEVLLRIDEEELAEKVGAWLLAFRQDEEMYMRLLGAARRARRPDVEARLNEEAQRLLIG